MYTAIKTTVAKEAKIVKLNKITKSILPKPIQQQSKFHPGSSYDNESAFECTFNEADTTESDLMTKLFVIKDYPGAQVYGDLSVLYGEFVYSLCESELYYLVENELGEQGFVPKDCCVNLEHTVNQARIRLMSDQVCKVTSL